MRDGFAAKAAPTKESNVYVIVWEFIAQDIQYVSHKGSFSL
jgi:hypothetical protein